MINLNQVRNNCLKSVPSSSFQISGEVQDEVLESDVSDWSFIRGVLLVTGFHAAEKGWATKNLCKEFGEESYSLVSQKVMFCKKKLHQPSPSLNDQSLTR